MLQPIIRLDMEPHLFVEELLRCGIVLEAQDRIIQVTGHGGVTVPEVYRYLVQRLWDLRAYLLDQPLPLEYGTCCACGQVEVRTSEHVARLPLPTVKPGTGWGCQACGLPKNGAYTVLCPQCFTSRAPVVYAVAGEMPSRDRVLIRELLGSVRHGAGCKLEAVLAWRPGDLHYE